MFSLNRGCRLKIWKSSMAWAITAVLLGACVASGQDGGRAGSHKDAWAVQSWTEGYGFQSFPPACHDRSYFSGMPRGLMLGGGQSQWPANSFTFKANATHLGSIQGREVYQVVQTLHFNSQTTAEGGSDVSVKRILLERRPEEYCMIFQEQGIVGPLADIVAIDDAQVMSIDGVPVLVTHDVTPGTGGYTLDGAWILENGAPFSLLDSAEEAIERANNEIVPPQCRIRPDRNGLDLRTFRARGQLQPITENTGAACDGEVELGLGIRNKRVVVVSKRRIP